VHPTKKNATPSISAHLNLASVEMWAVKEKNQQTKKIANPQSYSTHLYKTPIQPSSAGLVAKQILMIQMSLFLLTHIAPPLISVSNGPTRRATPTQNVTNWK